MSTFFENVHNCKCSWLKEYGTYCNNKSILLVFFFPSKQTCPNVTEGVRNASPQRLRSLLQPKDFPANHLEPILGSVRLFVFSYKIYTDLTWGMKNKKSIKKSVANLLFFSRFYHFSLFLLLSLCQIPYGASTSTAAHKNPVKTPWCHYCNHSYRNSRPLAAGAAGRWAGTPSSVGCWSVGAWSRAG